MSIPFDPPSVTGQTAGEQLQQVIRYLHRLAEQLNMAFEEMEVKTLDQNRSA